MYGGLHRNLRLWSIQGPMSSFGESIYVEIGNNHNLWVYMSIFCVAGICVYTHYSEAEETIQDLEDILIVGGALLDDLGLSWADIC